MTYADAALFDPAVSRADLLGSSAAGPNLTWRLEGQFKIGELRYLQFACSSRGELVGGCCDVG
jgi:hypothetical protein